MHTRYTTIESPIGLLTLVAVEEALGGVYFQEHQHPPSASNMGQKVVAGTDSVLAEAENTLARYFDGESTSFDLKLHTNGNDFQEEVWSILRDIPYGETITYGAIAERLGNRHLAQQVGRAVGRNPISIIIPCHRVVGANGALTGYAGGIERKQFLLDLEQPGRARAVPLF